MWGLDLRPRNHESHDLMEPASCPIFKWVAMGHLGGSVVKCLPLAQGMTLRSWDPVLHQAPYMEPASPSARVSASLSFCVSRE